MKAAGAVSLPSTAAAQLFATVQIPD